MIEVKQMTECNQEIIKTIVNWMYHWWGKEEGYSLEELQSYILHSFNSQGKLPQTYGLFIDNKLIGMYQLTYQDLESRPDIYPWVANVYIDKEYRHQGYSRYLLKTVYNYAKENQFHEIYLFTKHQGLYEKYGFEFIEEIDTFTKKPRIQRLYRLKIK